MQTPLGLVDVSQQPVAHDAASQTHWPPTQCRGWPLASLPHAAPLPHWQLPATQRSALKLLQTVQLPVGIPVDGEPQSLKLVCEVSHVDGELQQPLHPLEALHTQVALVPVPVQVVPVGQTLPVEPQTQPPPVHRFALVGSQVAQTPGMVPQWVVLIVVWQLPMASQQPFGHDVESQTQPPETQRWPLGQALPPGPHEQLPPTQRSPVRPQLPHARPPEPHAVAGLALSAVQVAPVQQPVQVCWQPRQAPFEQVPPLPAAVQSMQLPPLVPHWKFVVGETQWFMLSQQPFGHDV